MHDCKYVIISPCRDEAQFARHTLESVTQQTMLPSLWIIVDDGSTDMTPSILAEYASRFDFIRVIRREDRGRRSVGPGVIDAFYAGLEQVDLTQFEFLCKLDLDLELPSQYFELLVQRMLAEPRLGTCSGKAYYRDANSGCLMSESIGDEMSVGAAKFYRTECFNDIGGFVREVMWDGIDCHRCRMLGWHACSWDEQSLRFVHLRPMGSSHQGIFTGRMRHGAGQYFMGTGLPYMTISALYRMSKPPRLIGGFAMWWGYVVAMMQRRKRYSDAEFRRFLRRYQYAALFQGKRRATQRLNGRPFERWTVSIHQLASR